MARLTNYDRSTIKKAVLADIPNVDYDAQMQARATEICVGLMPPEIRRVWDKAALRGFIKCGAAWICCRTLSTPGFGNRDDDVVAALKADTKLTEIHEALDRQAETVSDLSQKLTINLELCTTDKQFRERFPDLAKYALAPEAVANLPATTDLMDSLKSAGLELDRVAS